MAKSGRGLTRSRQFDRGRDHSPSLPQPNPSRNMKHHRHNGPPEKTRHLRTRWDNRIGQLECDPLEAWKQGITVASTQCYSPEIKLYPPADAILFRRGRVIPTVLEADYSRIDSPELLTCSHCNTVTTLARSREVCEWCGETLELRRTDGCWMTVEQSSDNPEGL